MKKFIEDYNNQNFNKLIFEMRKDLFGIKSKLKPIDFIDNLE